MISSLFFGYIGNNKEIRSKRHSLFSIDPCRARALMLLVLLQVLILGDLIIQASGAAVAF